MSRLGLGVAAVNRASGWQSPSPAGAAARRLDLPRSSPELQGVVSGAVLEFLAAWDRSRAALNSEPHSFMMLRHGHVVAEGWWAPYRADAIHLLHSLSKSFTCTAVGFAVAEGRCAIDDRVIAFFPDKAPAPVGEHLSRLRVQDLLTMSLGRASATYGDIMQTDDWVRTCLSLPIEHAPGSTFNYDNWATYLLSAIVQQVSGVTTLNYLRPRFFDPLDVGALRWESDPRGITTGGWGLRATTETVSRLGLFYLRNGAWGGRQLLPRRWIDEATRFRIQQPSSWRASADLPHTDDPIADLKLLKATNDWYQGYGYQFWRCRHNAYRGDGAFGQFCIVLPDEDAVIAITSETGNMQGLLNLVWEHLLPGLHTGALPQDAASESQLRRELEVLCLPPPLGVPGAQPTPAGGRFLLEPNSLGAVGARFQFTDRSCDFTLEHSAGSSTIRCGVGRWNRGSSDMPGTPPLAPWDDFGARSRHLPVPVAAAGAWTQERTLTMQWRYYESGNRDTVTCRFEGERVEIEFQNSVSLLMASRPETRPILTGHRIPQR